MVNLETVVVFTRAPWNATASTWSQPCAPALAAPDIQRLRQTGTAPNRHCANRHCAKQALRQQTLRRVARFVGATSSLSAERSREGSPPAHLTHFVKRLRSEVVRGCAPRPVKSRPGQPPGISGSQGSTGSAGTTGTVIPMSTTKAQNDGEPVANQPATITQLALVDTDRLWRQAIGLVLDIGCQVLELGQVLTAVVRTEHQFATRAEAGAYIGPGATAVAAVSCGQSRCQCSCHVSHPIVIVGAVGGPYLVSRTGRYPFLILHPLLMRRSRLPSGLR
jgi:hypothetical protein